MSHSSSNQSTGLTTPTARALRPIAIQHVPPSTRLTQAARQAWEVLQAAELTLHAPLPQENATPVAANATFPTATTTTPYTTTSALQAQKAAHNSLRRLLNLSTTPLAVLALSHHLLALLTRHRASATTHLETAALLGHEMLRAHDIEVADRFNDLKAGIGTGQGRKGGRAALIREGEAEITAQSEVVKKWIEAFLGDVRDCLVRNELFWERVGLGWEGAGDEGLGAWGGIVDDVGRERDWGVDVRVVFRTMREEGDVGRGYSGGEGGDDGGVKADEDEDGEGDGDEAAGVDANEEEDAHADAKTADLSRADAEMVRNPRADMTLEAKAALSLIWKR